LRGHGGPRAAECDRAAPAVCLAHERDSAVEFYLCAGVAFYQRVELFAKDLKFNGSESHLLEDGPPVLLEVAADVCVAVCAALRPGVRLLHWCECGGEGDGDGDGDGDVHGCCVGWIGVVGTVSV